MKQDSVTLTSGEVYEWADELVIETHRLPDIWQVDAPYLHNPSDNSPIYVRIQIYQNETGDLICFNPFAQSGVDFVRAKQYIERLGDNNNKISYHLEGKKSVFRFEPNNANPADNTTFSRSIWNIWDLVYMKKTNGKFFVIKNRYGPNNIEVTKKEIKDFVEKIPNTLDTH